MTVVHPWVLVLLLPAAAVVWLTLRGRGYGPGRFALIATLRMLLAAGAVLAVSGLGIRLPSPERHVVFLIDDSPSFADRMASAETLVRARIKTLGPDDVATVLHFDRTASADPSRRKEEATDIEAALDAASATIPSGAPGAVFLLSDGIETTGDATRAALRLAGRGIPVYVPRPSTEVPPDARVSLYDAAPRVAPHERFSVVWRIDATRPMSVEVRSGVDGKLDRVDRVAASPGAPAFVRYGADLPTEGLRIFEARISAEGDRFPQNNSAAAPVYVTGRPLVVCLSGYANESPAEQIVRRSPTFRVLRLTSGADLTPAVLSEASAVVLDDFPARPLGTASADLAAWVRESGGGLVMFGGPGSFGAGGYVDTAVDAVLPVHCDPREADKKPVALVVLLDSSGSMGEGGGEKMETARAAALRTIERLRKSDLASVIAFRVTPEVVVPLRPVADPSSVARRLASISPNGGTNIFPAIDQAVAILADPEVRAPLKHILLLSDGKSLRSPGDAGAAIERCLKAGVTLSAVATGDDIDRKLLEDLSAGTKGRFYMAKTIGELADLFLDDLRQIDGPLVRQGSFAIQPADVTALPGTLRLDLPGIAAYNRTRLREGATLVLKHTVDRTDEPIVAIRRAGLGRSAALTFSFARDWEGSLADWPGLPGLVMQALAYTRRVEPEGDYALSVRRDGGNFDATVVLARSLVDRPLPDLRLRIVDSAGASVEVPIRRESPTTCRAEARTSMDGVATATLLGGAAPLATTYVPTSCPAEYRDLAPRIDLLERIARITGGREVDSLDAFRAAGGRAPKRERDATPWLLGATLLFYLIELSGRAVGRL